MDRAVSFRSWTGRDRRVADPVRASVAAADALNVMKSVIACDERGNRRRGSRGHRAVELSGDAGGTGRSGPSVCGTYADLLIREAEGWRFRRRELIHAFKGEMRLTLP